MKDAAFIEWDKQLKRNEQRPRGVFFRQKYASINCRELAKSPFYQRMKSAMKMQPQNIVVYGKTREGMSVSSRSILAATQFSPGCWMLDDTGFLVADDATNSHRLNPIEGIEPLDVVHLLASMVDVELNPDQESTGIQLVLALPDSKTIRDFVDIATIENAERLGLSPEKIEALNH